MKTVSKLITINDGMRCTEKNGDRLLVESCPRTERIINAFLSAGYELRSSNFRVNPGIPGGQGYNFYLGGWDFLFTKEIEDDEEDRGEEILLEAIKGAEE